MNSKNKIIAFYLPQFHEMEENNIFWGKGFTEWNNVKSAIPLFQGHAQPRIPSDEIGYYDLTDIDVMKKQVMLAKSAGLYGFCFYHYWFYEKPVMDKPILNYLNDKTIDFPFCFCWANESWNNGWAKADEKIILEQKYGDEIEWERHFNFFLPFFRDKRYMREGNKPVLIIYRPYLCPYMKKILDFWQKLAINNGFDGIYYISQRFEICEDKVLYEAFDKHIEYEPGFVWQKKEYAENKIPLRIRIHDHVLRKYNIDIKFLKNRPVIKDYDLIWKRILELNPENRKSIPGAFVDWDNTPRHKQRGVICKGANPDKFEKYMTQQIANMHFKYHTNYLFIFAWNEWGEGGYLEPDKLNGDGYLKALRRAIDKND